MQICAWLLLVPCTLLSCVLFACTLYPVALYTVACMSEPLYECKYVHGFESLCALIGIDIHKHHVLI